MNYNDMIDEYICKCLEDGSSIDIIKVRQYIKRKMKEAFVAGYNVGEYDASRIDWERSGDYPSNPGYLDFKEYFKKKYK